MLFGRVRFGFMWDCPWRLEWRKSFEYWDRCQCGPFYLLMYPPRPLPDDWTDEDSYGSW